MLRRGPSNLPFAARAKSEAGRTHAVHNKAAFCSRRYCLRRKPSSLRHENSAAQQISPVRPFIRTKLGGFQTDVSPQSQPATKECNELPLANTANVGAKNVRTCRGVVSTAQRRFPRLIVRLRLAGCFQTASSLRQGSTIESRTMKAVMASI